MTNGRRRAGLKSSMQAERASGGATEIALSGRDGLALELSVRQRQVLQLLWQGETNKAIAQRLDLGESTVNVHVRNLMKMLGAQNRTQVVLLTDKLGLAANNFLGRRTQ